MGRRKIEIRAIEDKNKRQVTFFEATKGIFNKAEQMCLLDKKMKMSLVVFSPAEKPFPFHHPSAADTVIDRFDLTNFENELERVKNMAMARMQKIESRRSSHEASTSSSTRVNCGFDDPVTVLPPHL
ncbi:hypothetical protein Syun_031355 [Stephania yunnanensis]|uniref:MADS-box domain-containing protein n=1 Tax=Stephania yunnanensis TaxID=152371 RepID=A0AAP0DX50_9MAGN